MAPVFDVYKNIRLVPQFFGEGSIEVFPTF